MSMIVVKTLGNTWEIVKKDLIQWMTLTPSPTNQFYEVRVVLPGNFKDLEWKISRSEMTKVFEQLGVAEPETFAN